MPITSYSDLQAAVSEWLVRADDAALVARIPDLIQFGEDRIFFGGIEPYETPAVRTRAMIQTTNPSTYQTTAGVNTLALPSGFLEGRSLYLNTNPVAPINYLAPQQFWNETQGPSGRPKAFTIEGTNFVFGPTPDAAYGVRVLYYARYDALATTPTNALLTDAPHVYLYASLIEAAPYIQDDRRVATWLAMYRSAVGGLNRQSQMEQFSGSPLSSLAQTRGP